MVKTKTLVSTNRPMEFTNNGISYMLTTGRESQPRDNSTRDSDSTSKEISTLSHLSQIRDTLISSTTETWSFRFQTEEELKSGTSINNP
jgi:hypothetical protein